MVVCLSIFSLVIVGAFAIYRAEESIEEKETNLLRAAVSLQKVRAAELILLDLERHFMFHKLSISLQSVNGQLRR